MSSRFRAVGEALSLGLTFPAYTVGGFFLGKLADRLLGTGKVFSWAGATIGVAAAFWSLARFARRADKP